MKSFRNSWLVVTCLCSFIFQANAQETIDQNGIKTTVTQLLGTRQLGGALRYEIAQLGYNSYHWQSNGVVMIEIFTGFYSGGYDKYILDQGSNTGFTPVLKLVESHGAQHLSRISLGQVYDLSTTYGGYVNRALPIYLETNYYSMVQVRFTYLQSKVTTVTQENQLAVHVNPNPTAISEFTVSVIPNIDLSATGHLLVQGTGVHTIHGSLGVGTASPQERLSVNGKIRAHEIRVESDPATWPDYVFKDGYNLPSLDSVKKFIEQNHHLPDIPSASDVARNGVDLGALNRILLQKIEELTLYVYDLKKQDERRELAFKKLEYLINQKKKKGDRVQK